MDSIRKNFKESVRMMERAQKSVIGGANSTMRVLPYQLPMFIKQADGCTIWDVDGNELIDLNMAYGPLIFGHKSPLIIKAIKEELKKRGTTLGFPHELSHLTAELIKKSFPSIELLRFASTGTEVTQTAVRLARAYTGKSHLVLFEGHYHGSTDSVFHKYHAPIGDLEQAQPFKVIPATEGMGGAPSNAFVLPWNDSEALINLLEEKGDLIAAVIMEPVMGNAGIIPPLPEYLQKVREITQKHKVILIFDEVITCFRIARGGAQERYGVQSDLTTLSKAMNGGMPVTAIGGKKGIMQLIEKGKVFHGGVYSGHPAGMAATLAVQQEFEEKGYEIYELLERNSNLLGDGVKDIFNRLGVPVLIQNVGAMLSFSFINCKGLKSVNNYREIKQVALPERNIHFQHKLQEAGVFIHPNHFEPWYLSTTHTADVVELVLKRIEKTAKKINWNKDIQTGIQKEMLK